MIVRLLLLMLLSGLVLACTPQESPIKLERIIEVRDSLKREYIPDGRVAKFDIDVIEENNRIVVSGDTDQAYVLATFMNKLLREGFSVEDKVSLLPDSTTLKYKFAIVNNSVANLRTEPRHSAELTSQSTLGTILKVLKITDEWYMVQTPDDYIAWVDHGGVALKTDFQVENWKKRKKVIVTRTFSRVFKNSKLTSPISDVVLGNILEFVSVDQDVTAVEFPDGRIGYVASSDVTDFQTWLDNLRPSENLVEYYARSLLGVPYLWGGTSAKGMDCSGFTKTVYFMNGLIIPRDASQQIDAGKVVDENRTFEGLKRGDLLFFGKPATDSTKQKTTHVGIWLGADQFIHASKRVRISSIDPNHPNYDEFNKNRYLGSRRYLRNLEGNILNMKEDFILLK